jgi:hypothetical protein
MAIYQRLVEEWQDGSRFPTQCCNGTSIWMISFRSPFQIWREFSWSAMPVGALGNERYADMCYTEHGEYVQVRSCIRVVDFPTDPTNVKS